MHGAAANAAQSAEDEDGPTGLDFDGALDELRTGEQDERQRGGLFVAELVGDGREHVGPGGGELGVGAVGQGHDALALLEANDTFSGADDFTGEVAAKDGGQLDAHEFCGRAIADLDIDGIDACGVHANEHLASADFGVVHVLYGELVHAAETVDHDCFHDCVSLGYRDDGSGCVFA